MTALAVADFTKDNAAFTLVPSAQGVPHPKLGSAKGLVEVSDDFGV